MATMTKKQIEEINNKCKNGWKFDVVYFVYHEEKTFIKKIKQNDEYYLEFRLYYNSQNQISLHISKYEYSKDKKTATTKGMGKDSILEETKYSRKNINNLIIITQRLTDEELLKINAETKVSSGYGLILQSEEF